jgi:hypothetical protein
MADFIYLAIAVFFSIVPVWVIIFIRGTVKRQRQEVIQDLDAVFHLPNGGSDSFIVPSFEFVKYKYYLKRDHTSEGRAPKDFSTLAWFFAVIPLVLTLFLLNSFTAFVVGQAAGVPLPGFISGEVREALNHAQTWKWAILAAYAGAFLFMARAFFRAINNFDLSPASFVGATNNLLFGVILASLIYFGLLRLPELMGQQVLGDVSLAVVLLISFAAGYFPDSATRELVRSSRLRDFKREDAGMFSAFKAIPIEVIDGIDTGIRDRLSDYHISTVQNLAASNPIMLFVETPYGVYQIMDWVAQAQLCASVGPRALVQLWSMGVRTIFDLERLALHDGFKDPQLLQAVGAIIIGQPSSQSTASKPPTQYSEAAVIANIAMRLDHPYVHRLRQIFIRVGERLGDTNRRLPPLAACPLRHESKCYLRLHSVEAAPLTPPPAQAAAGR